MGELIEFPKARVDLAPCAVCFGDGCIVCDGEGHVVVRVDHSGTHVVGTLTSVVDRLDRPPSA